MSAGDYVLCLDFSYLCCLIIFRRGDVCIVGGGVRNCDGFNFGAIFKGVEFLNKFCDCVVPEKHKRPYVFLGGSCLWSCMDCLLCMLVLVSVIGFYA